MAIMISKGTESAIDYSLVTLVDLISTPVSLMVVYYLMTNMPKALGLEKR